MAHVLIMPRQGNTVESCIIGEWKVKEGDTVETDTPVCSVETDKAAFEVPAGARGLVLKILHSSGEDVPVLQPIMVIGEAGENWEDALPSKSASSDSLISAPALEASQEREGLSITDSNKAVKAAHISLSPRAKKLAEAEVVNPYELGMGSGPGGRIIEQDIKAFLIQRPPLTLAAKEELRKRIREGLAANIEGAGSGIGGRITADELAASKTGEMAGLLFDASQSGEFSDTAIKGIRKIISDRMMSSHNSTAPFTLHSSALALRLQELRSRFKAAAPELGLNKISVNDIILFIVSRVLPLYPYINAHKLDGVIRSYKNVHLGMAVSTNRGLMVPVIRNANILSLVQLSQRAKELAESCRNGTIRPDELQGSSFTVSNLGNFGVESFSPVINIPEVAILGVCNISPKPAEISPGNYEILPHLGLSLTVDHAVVDGAPAAEFLKRLCEAIRDLDLWLAK